MGFLQDHAFDSTFCAWILQHLIRVDDLRQGLRELRRVIKRGGCILLAENIPPTAAPFTKCLIEKDELGGIYFHEDRYEGVKLPVCRRLMGADEMVAALREEGLCLLTHGRKTSLDVFVVQHESASTQRNDG